MDNERLLRLRQVMDRLGIAKSTVYKFVKLGIIPRPIKLGAASVWVESEIDDCVATVISASRARSDHPTEAGR